LTRHGLAWAESVTELAEVAEAEAAANLALRVIELERRPCRPSRSYSGACENGCEGRFTAARSAWLSIAPACSCGAQLLPDGLDEHSQELRAALLALTSFDF
jgi:hypothetical protein